MPYQEQRVLYRSDTHAPLSVVSQRYQEVQPKQILEFYRDLTEQSGFELETAGVLKGGKKFWALARTGQATALKGADEVRGYLLLATSCDGTLATTATPTTVRVVCNNTLQMATGDSKGAVKVPHSTQFDAAAVKNALGLGLSSWDSFMRSLKDLSQRPVSRTEADAYFRTVLGEPLADESNPSALEPSRTLQQVLSLYQGTGLGSTLSSSRNTAWGLVNAMTEFVDHRRRARNQDYRLDSAWFGQGAQLKQQAMTQALALLQ
jgi:phage/plasmid-like protein (TIGR03299 family)